MAYDNRDDGRGYISPVVTTNVQGHQVQCGGLPIFDVLRPVASQFLYGGFRVQCVFAGLLHNLLARYGSQSLKVRS